MLSKPITVLFFIIAAIILVAATSTTTTEARGGLEGFVPGCIFSEKLIPFSQGQDVQDSAVLLNSWFFYWRAAQLFLGNSSSPRPNHDGSYNKQPRLNRAKNMDDPVTTLAPAPSPSGGGGPHLFIPFDLGGAGWLGDLPDNTELELLENHQAVRMAKNFELAKSNLYPGRTFYGIATLDLAGSVQFVTQIKNVSKETGAVHLDFAAFLISVNDVQSSSCSWTQRSTNLTRACSQQWQPLNDGCF